MYETLLCTTFQLLWMLVATSFVGFLPDGAFKRWVNNWVTLTSFRILARSLSSVLTYHNVQWMPKTGGVCVANHTTPIDVVILSTMTTFALVSHMAIFFIVMWCMSVPRVVVFCFIWCLW